MLNKLLIKDRKKILLYAILLILLAGAGFTGFTLMATNKNSNKKLPAANHQLPPVQTHRGISAPEVQTAPALVTTMSRSGSSQKGNAANPARLAQQSTLNAKGRDVFREFYVRHAGTGATGPKGSAAHLEQNLPGFSMSPLTASGFVQALPPAQTINAVEGEHIKDVIIFGITCASDDTRQKSRDLPGYSEAQLSMSETWECSAITSEGVLKKGDKVGSETVLTVNKTSFTTGKRIVKFN